MVSAFGLRPRLWAAIACFTLGGLVLGLGFFGWPLPTRPAAEATGLAELDPLGFDPLAASAPLPAAPEPVVAPTDVIVYISGAVARPDVYRLPPGARVKDLVVAAGGLTAGAAPASLNLAQPLSDAGHIHVPSLDELAASPVAAPVSPDAPAAERSDGLINLNTASVSTLSDLPGIGPTLAERIVSYRNESGPFTTVEQLGEVSGIGDKLYSQLAPLVTVGS